ncbi:MFS transporter [Streptomyces sp. Q6]|uniref:MFS transporter n=1 Tax=Streptomyces citrinus TaxID=3118173 RepID=A0ACD5AAL2_9ACTN
MSSAPATYRSLLRTSGAAAFFVPAAVGRVGIAMTGIALVWLVHARTGSYAAAGLVTGGFAVADALVGPQLGRLVDRFGQERVVPAALAAHAVSVALLLTGAAPDLVAGALIGATLPQLSALSAARWSALLSGGRAAALPTAFALEALANGVSYLAGPALVSVLGAAGRPDAGVLLAAALVVGGGLALVAQRRTAPPPPATPNAGTPDAPCSAPRSCARPRSASSSGCSSAPCRCPSPRTRPGAARRTSRRPSTPPPTAPTCWAVGRTGPGAAECRRGAGRPPPRPDCACSACR